MPLFLLTLEDPSLENDVGEEVEGITGGDIVLCKGHEDNCFIEALAKDFKPYTGFHAFFVVSWLCVSSILSRIPYPL